MFLSKKCKLKLFRITIKNTTKHTIIFLKQLRASLSLFLSYLYQNIINLLFPLKPGDRFKLKRLEKAIKIYKNMKDVSILHWKDFQGFIWILRVRKWQHVFFIDKICWTCCHCRLLPSSEIIEEKSSFDRLFED